MDILLPLAFASTIAVTVLMRKSLGPEGPVGAWILR